MRLILICSWPLKNSLCISIPRGCSNPLHINKTTKDNAYSRPFACADSYLWVGNTVHWMWEGKPGGTEVCFVKNELTVFMGITYGLFILSTGPFVKSFTSTRPSYLLELYSNSQGQETPPSNFFLPFQYCVNYCMSFASPYKF